MNCVAMPMLMVKYLLKTTKSLALRTDSVTNNRTKGIMPESHRWPVKVKRKVVCSTRLLDNSGDQTLYQQGGTDHEQSIHDILGVVETLSEISF